MLDPKDLNVIVAISRFGSFARAARELNLSVPAVSKRLAALEVRLGVRLFDRSTRRVSPTPDGELIVGEARRVMTSLADLEALATRVRRAPAGHLRVHSTLGFGRRVLAPLLSAFAKQHADVTLDLNLTQGLPSGAVLPFDLAVWVGMPSDTTLAVTRIAANQRVLAAAPRYFKRAGTPQSPQELLRHRCLLVREGASDVATWQLEGPNGAERLRVPHAS